MEAKDMVRRRTGAEERSSTVTVRRKKNIMTDVFEDLLVINGGISPEGAEAAISTLTGMFGEEVYDLMCPYISGRLGVAEWIVKRDIAGRCGKGFRRSESA
jgi:hypothetical protein